MAQVEFCVEPQDAWVAKLTQQCRVLAQVGQSGPCLDAAWGPREQRPLSGRGLGTPVLIHTRDICLLPCLARFSEVGAVHTLFSVKRGMRVWRKPLRPACGMILHFTCFLLSSPFADTLDEFKEMNKGTWKKLQEKFAPRSPEGKHTAWARALPRPRT